jgi:branched-subunit amino acid aminotransferase/4-amino-4-deoxychorismate lyase
MERDGIEGAYIDWADSLMKIWLNDRLVEDLNLPATGGGWLMGDGAFESLRTYDSKPFALQRHLERLVQTAEKMEMAKPDVESIRAGVHQVIFHNVCRPYGRLRITVLSDGNVVITHIPFTENSNSLKLTNAESVQLSTRMSAGLKTVSYAENSIALRRAQRQGFDDVVFANEKGNIVESALANIIWFDGESWWTPSLATGCLPGVTRALLIENFGVKEGFITPAALEDMKAVAITSSVREIVRIERYGSKLLGPSKEFDELRDSFHAWILGNLEP